MCGILGLTFLDDSHKVKENNNLIKLLMACFEIGMRETAIRGYDAAGVAYITGHENSFKTNIFKSKKNAWKATISEEWIETIQSMRKNSDAKDVHMHWIGHCRKMTEGKTDNNENNHPLEIDNRLIMVHNGSVKDFKEIIKKDTSNFIKNTMPGEVDSGVFGTLALKYLKDNKTDLQNGIKEAFENKDLYIPLEGAVVILDKLDANKIFMIRTYDRPLYVSSISQINAIIYASQSEFIYNFIYNVCGLANVFNADPGLMNYSLPQELLTDKIFKIDRNEHMSKKVFSFIDTKIRKSFWNEYVYSSTSLYDGEKVYNGSEYYWEKNKNKVINATIVVPEENIFMQMAEDENEVGIH
jgi:glucosamine 6-phosphate synthetase-like amidotransferase/phosphosugar isomerase protein